MDNVITFVEKTNHPKFVTENVHVLYSKDSPYRAAGIFLSWVLTKGQKYNHVLGFLNLEDTVLSQQRTIEGTTFTAAPPATAPAR